MKKEILFGFGVTSVIFSLLFVTSFTNNTKDNCIQFNNEQGNFLYKNCGNELAITSDFDNTYITGATKIKGKKDNQLFIIPNAETVTVKAQKNGATIATKEYKTKAAPIPNITLKKETGLPINQKRGERINSFNHIKVVAQSTDQHFLRNYPKDARYIVTKYQVQLVRGNEVIKKEDTTDKTLDLSSLGIQESKDRIVLIIQEIKRKNFQNKLIEVPIEHLVYNIPLNE